MFLRFWVKWDPPVKKRPFWAQIGYAKKSTFLKNIDPNLAKNVRKVLF